LVSKKTKAVTNGYKDKVLPLLTSLGQCLLKQCIKLFHNETGDSIKTASNFHRSVNYVAPKALWQKDYQECHQLPKQFFQLTYQL